MNAFKHESVKPSYKKDLEALKYQIEALEFNNIEPTKIYPATYNILTSPITQLDSYQDIRSSSIESDLNFSMQL